MTTLNEQDLHNIVDNVVRRIVAEGLNNSANYSHFAVNKQSGKIVNGWDYANVDPNELRQFKKDYFIVDLLDYELDPKMYRIVTLRTLQREGIDPNNDSNWANA